MSLAIDVSSGNNRTIVKGIVGLAVAAAICLVLAVLAGGGVRITFLVLAVILLAVAGLPALKLRTLLRPRRILFDPNGLQYQDPAGPWACAWSELAALVVQTSGHQVRNAQTQLVKAYGPTINLLLVPAGPEFANRHPELAGRQDADGQFAIPLGPNPELVPALDEAARQFAPPGLYQGVR